jgi:hypothetical protein
MPGLQQEIYGYPEHFRARKDQDILPQVQERKGEAEHLRVYDQDQPEELNTGRRSSSPERVRP